MLAYNSSQQILLSKFGDILKFIKKMTVKQMPIADHTAVRSATRKLSYRKEEGAMRPIYGCPEKF